MPGVGPVLGLRDRKKQQTRERLEAAAVRLFAAEGYDQVTVDGIAAEAGVSARTFFRYFGSKEDVLLGDDAERLDRLERELTSRPPDEDPLTAVRLAVLSIANDYTGSTSQLVARTQLAASAPSVRGRWLGLQENWETTIARVVAARLGVDPATDLRPRLIGAAAVAALRVAIDTWLADGGEASLPSLADTALRLVWSSDAGT